MAGLAVLRDQKSVTVQFGHTIFGNCFTVPNDGIFGLAQKLANIEHKLVILPVYLDRFQKLFVLSWRCRSIVFCI